MALLVSNSKPRANWSQFYAAVISFTQSELAEYDGPETVPPA